MNLDILQPLAHDIWNMHECFVSSPEGTVLIQPCQPSPATKAVLRVTNKHTSEQYR